MKPSSPSVCPECGQSVPVASLNGLCPACLARLALEPAPIANDLSPEGAPVQTAAELSQPKTASFGDYELLEEIGRGGMGIVYRARQRSLNRIVAVKLIPFGPLATAESVRRFRAEAEAAAHLQHPHIVAIHEIGEHEGQHYFSMAFIEGGTLAERLRDGPMPARRAAACLETIARAVQFAHERGVLHRDLKPSNLLMDRNEEPHISDFGLAKRLPNSQLETQNSELTLSGQVLGSPNYMPPEQASSQRAEIGPRSDLYSLGAVLYHALTGRPPFQAESVEALLNRLIHFEPVAPRLLNPSVPRDLETICLKCLEKEPARRYAAAQELADDLRRFLEGAPVLARPVTRLQRAAKWARRRPAIAALSASVVALLLAIAIGSPIAALKFREQRNLAETNFLAARHAVETYLARVTENPKLRTRDLQSLRLGLLQTAVPFFEDFVRQRRDDPRLRSDLIWALSKLAGLRNDMGDVTNAIAAYQQLIDLGTAAVATSTNRPHALLALVSFHAGLSGSLTRAGRLADAENAAQAGLAVAAQMEREFPGNANTLEALAQSHEQMGSVLEHAGKREEAIAAIRESLKWWQTQAAQNPGESRPARKIGAAYDHLGRNLKEARRYADAEANYREGVAVLEKLWAAGASDPEYRLTLGDLLSNLGVVLKRQERYPEAEAAYQRSLELTDELAAQFPSQAHYQMEAARTLANWAAVVKRERPDEALAAREQVVRRAEAVVMRWPDVPSYRRTFGIFLWELASSLLDHERFAGAEQACQRSIEVLRQLTVEFPQTPEYRMHLADSYHTLGRVVRSAKGAADSERWFRQSLDQWEDLAAASPKSAQFQAGLSSAAYYVAAALLAQSRAQEAESMARRALTLQRTLVAANPQATDYHRALPRFVSLWLQTVLETSDHATAAAHAEEYVQVWPESGRDGGSYATAAQVVTKCIGLAQRDEALTTGQRAEVAERYARNAAALLRLGLERGLLAEDLNRDPELSPLRDHPAFKELMANLPKTNRPPP